MNNYKTEGIILKRTNINEADRILIILTRRFGKISAIAKGIRKTKSKLGGHLELFYKTNFLITEGKNLDIVSSAELIEDFSSIRSSRIKTNVVFYFAELINYFVKDKEESSEIYNLFVNALYYLEENKNELVLSFFLVHLMISLGHFPEIEYCVKCRKKLIIGVNYFSSSFGGVLCQECQRYDMNSNKVSDNCIKTIRILSKGDLDVLNKLHLDQETLKETNKIMIEFSEHVAEKRFMSTKYLL